MNLKRSICGWASEPSLSCCCFLWVLLLSGWIAACAEDPVEGDDDGGLDDCGQAVVTVPSGCDDCHGAPPETATHPENNRCHRCHGQVVDGDFGFVQADLHQNGEVDFAVGCSSCHGWNLGVSPPSNLAGRCGRSERGVGAHWALRHATALAHRVSCSNCHAIPESTWAAGHIDGDGRAEVVFDRLATASGADPAYDPETHTCAGVYCHGATLAGGALGDPNWYDTSGAAAECGACHGLTDPDGNSDADCSSCHPSSVDADGQILAFGEHLNGRIDF